MDIYIHVDIHMRHEMLTKKKNSTRRKKKKFCAEKQGYVQVSQTQDVYIPSHAILKYHLYLP